MVTIVTNYSAMKSSLLEWLRLNSGTGMGDAIFTRQEGNRPAKPYATIQVITDNIKTGDDDVRQEWDGGTPALTYRTVGLRELTVTVPIYTDPAENTI